MLLSDGAANEGQNCDDVVTTTTVGTGRNKHTVTTTTKDQDPHCLQPCQSAVNDATTYKAIEGAGLLDPLRRPVRRAVLPGL